MRKSKPFTHLLLILSPPRPLRSAVPSPARATLERFHNRDLHPGPCFGLRHPRNGNRRLDARLDPQTVAGRRNRRTIPAGPARRRQSPFRFRGTGRKSSRAARGVHVDRAWRCSTPSDRPAHRGRLGIDYISNPYVREHRLLRRGPRRGLRHEPRFRTAAAMRPDLMLLYGVTGEHHRHGQTPRTGHPLYMMGDYMEESPAGQGRMAGPRGGALRPAPGRRRHAAADRPGSRGP